MAKTGGTRRTKKEVLTSKVEMIDTKITELNGKIEALAAEKEELLEKLKELESAENKAKEEAEFKELRSLIRKKNIPMDELKRMLHDYT